MNIADFIPEGRQNAVTRAELASSLAITDRLVRRLIAKAREHGELILNDGTGYYRSHDVHEIYRQYRTDRARALSVLRRLKTMRRLLKEAGIEVK